MSSIYILNQKTYIDANSLPVIGISYIDAKIDLDNYDALIFTSKNGVNALNHIDARWRDKACYSIGKATSQTMISYGVTPAYTANSSYGDDFAKEIIPLLEHKRVLFAKAQVVYSSLQEILRSHHISLDTSDVYQTTCIAQHTPPQQNAIIIFSSPSTVTCFFENFTWDKSYKAIAIGTRTASFIPKNVDYTVSDVQDIEHCIALARQMELAH